MQSIVCHTRIEWNSIFGKQALSVRKFVLPTLSLTYFLIVFDIKIISRVNVCFDCTLAL